MDFTDYTREELIQYIEKLQAANNSTRIDEEKSSAANQKIQSKSLNDRAIPANGHLNIFNQNLAISETSLIESEARFRNLFENSPIGIAITVRNSSIIANKAFRDLIGYSEEEMRTIGWQDVTVPGDFEKIQESLEPLMDGSASILHHEKRFIHKNGSLIWTNVSVYLQKDNKGNPDFFVTTVINVTQKKINEKRIRILSLAVEQNPASIVITDEEGDIEYVNNKFKTYTQYSLDLVKGRKPRIFNPGHLSADDYATMWKKLKSGNIWQGEFKNRKKDQTLFWENVIISPLIREDGLITNYVLIMDDITDRKKMFDDLIVAKNKAEENDRLKSAFLANMSHEIRTPMNSMLGFTELLKEPDFSIEQKNNFIEIISKSGKRMLNTVTGIIEISKIEAGIATVNLLEIDINERLLDVVAELKPEADQKGIGLHVDTTLPGTCSTVVMDPEKLDSILSNLINNAIKYTDFGSIHVGCKLKGRVLEFYVQDSGVGVPAERQKAIFNRFEQADISDVRARQGSGLGLSIAKSYVEMLGGTIWLESEIGKGSTFYFTVMCKPDSWV